MPRSTVAVATALLLLSACAHRLATGSTPAEGDPVSQARCPMSVPGASLSAADVPRGEALTFTTVGQPAELQDRVQSMADLLNRRQHHVPASGFQQAAWGGRATRWGGATLPPSYATVLQVEEGAVLTVTSDAPDDIEQLRYALRVRAWRLQRLGCAQAPGTHGG
jgi:hypothetical protein